jgi:hypothetical protein
MKMEQAECSETSAYKIQTPGNYPEESIQQGTYNVTARYHPTRTDRLYGYLMSPKTIKHAYVFL